jgi:glycosyltransferase involved in cell wall biosynthesis
VTQATLISSDAIFSAGDFGEHSGRGLNVTYIVGSFRDAGAERRTLELIKHLDRRFFNPSVILMEGTGVERALDWTDQCFVMGIPEGGNSRWFGRSLSFANAIRKTRKQLIAWKSHIVHAMLPAASILGGIAARLAGVPVLIGSRPCLTSLYRSGGGLVDLTDKVAFRLAHANLANSVAVGREMIEIGGCPPNKCETIHNGVDVRRFHPSLSRSWRASMGWNDENVVFGMIANFRAYKRHKDFVSAAAIIVKQVPQSRFVMVGADYGLGCEIVQQVAKLGLEEKIKILDSDPFPEKIFAAIDVYVCTSDSEGFSNVILEAMACGKPVIATRAGGNEEAVLDGITGFLVPCFDPPAIAHAAVELARDSSVRYDMGLKGRGRVETEFSLERMVSSHEALYLRLFARRRNSRR